MAKVSIIIPIYNTEKYLEKCLDSIINQTLKDIEIICVNDGSTDSSSEILNEYAKKDNRITVIHKQNEGPGKARNYAISLAKGEYIGFVDSDDWVDEDYFEKLYIAATNNDCDIAVASILKHKKKYVKYNVLYNSTSIATTTDTQIKLCGDKTKRFFYAWNKIYKTTLIKNNNITFPEDRIYEDVIFAMKSIFYANKVVCVPAIEYHYIERPNSIVKAKDIGDKKKKDYILAYTELQDFAKENNINLPENLNYSESHWKGPLKIYVGNYKLRVLLFGFIPIFFKHKK